MGSLVFGVTLPGHAHKHPDTVAYSQQRFDEAFRTRNFDRRSHYIRAGSPTFGEWEGVILSSENKRQFYVPEGFAHGFLVTAEKALFSYKCTAKYNQSAEGYVLWNDPEIGIGWPVEGSPVLSDKDRAARPLRDIPVEELPRYGP